MQVTTKESFWSSVLHLAATRQWIGGRRSHTSWAFFWEFRSKWQMLSMWFKRLSVLFFNSSCCFSTDALKNSVQFSQSKWCQFDFFSCSKAKYFKWPYLSQTFPIPAKRSLIFCPACDETSLDTLALSESWGRVTWRSLPLRDTASSCTLPTIHTIHTVKCKCLCSHTEKRSI